MENKSVNSNGKDTTTKHEPKSNPKSLTCKLNESFDGNKDK